LYNGIEIIVGNKILIKKDIYLNKIFISKFKYIIVIANEQLNIQIGNINEKYFQALIIYIFLKKLREIDNSLFSRNSIAFKENNIFLLKINFLKINIHIIESSNVLGHIK
jgi:hypothetical protein